MTAIIADTGPLYAAVDPDDKYHRRSQAELERIDRDNLNVITISCSIRRSTDYSI